MLSEEEKLFAQIQRRLSEHDSHLQIQVGCYPGNDAFEEEAADDSKGYYREKTSFFVRPVDWWLTVNAGGEYHFDHFWDGGDLIVYFVRNKPSYSKARAKYTVFPKDLRDLVEKEREFTDFKGESSLNILSASACGGSMLEALQKFEKKLKLLEHGYSLRPQGYAADIMKKTFDVNDDDYESFCGSFGDD